MNKLTPITVYISTKVEDELPNKEGYYFSNYENQEDLHWFDRYFGSGMVRHFIPKSWLKPQSKIVLSPEELKEILQELTNRIVENADTAHLGNNFVVVDESSITNELNKFLNEIL